MASEYKRQYVGQFIIKALQTLGGSASREAIKEEIVADDEIALTYEDVFEPIQSKSGNAYIPFNLDFNFDLVGLRICGIIQDYNRRGDITLTEAGRTVNYCTFPSPEERSKMDEYWASKHQERAIRKKRVFLIIRFLMKGMKLMRSHPLLLT